MNQLVDHPNNVHYFWPDHPVGHIQDDHIPFLNKGTRTKQHISRKYDHTCCAALLGDPHPAPLCQVYVSSTLFPPPSRPCGTRLTTTSRTWIAPPFRTSARSCRFLSWSTSTPDPPSLQTHRALRKKKKPACHSTACFLLMFHRSQDLRLLLYRLKGILYLMLFKHQQYAFPELITEMCGWDSTLHIRRCQLQKTFYTENMFRDAWCHLQLLFFFF